jgi:hypothetical protein
MKVLIGGGQLGVTGGASRDQDRDWLVGWGVAMDWLGMDQLDGFFPLHLGNYLG